MITICSAIAERLRCSALQCRCISFGQKWKTGTRETIFYGHYRSIFHCDIIGEKLKIRSITPFKVIHLDSAGATAAPRDNSLTGRTKRFGDALRHVLPRMPSEHAELPQFFDTVEKLFKMYQVPADVQAQLLIPILSTQTKTIIGRMSGDDLESYNKSSNFC